MFRQLGKSDVKITRLKVFTKEKSRLVNMRADMDIQFDDEVDLMRLEQTQSGRGIREGSCTSRYKTGRERTELPHRDLGVPSLGGGGKVAMVKSTKHEDSDDCSQKSERKLIRRMEDDDLAGNVNRRRSHPRKVSTILRFVFWGGHSGQERRTSASYQPKSGNQIYSRLINQFYPFDHVQLGLPSRACQGPDGARRRKEENEVLNLSQTTYPSSPTDDLGAYMT